MKPLLYLTRLRLIIFFIVSIQSKAIAGDVRYHIGVAGTVQQDLSYTRTGLNFIDSALVTIIDKKTNDSLSFYSDVNGKWMTALPLNRHFIIRVSKNGYVTKLINLNTRVPARRLADFTFQLDVFLFEKINEIDVSVLKYPIATVKYKHHNNDFFYNYNYTDKINQGLKKLYLAYYYKHNWKTDSTHRVVSEKPIESNIIVNNDVHPFEITTTDVKFQVQIIATISPRQLNCSFFKGVKKVTEIEEDGLYKYTMGDFTSASQAKSLNRELISQGFTDSFIVAVKDNKRIPVREAIALVKR